MKTASRARSSAIDGRDARGGQPWAFARYVAWQAPGWLAAGVTLWWLREAFDVATWVVTAAFTLYVAKDLVLYPAMRTVFRVPVSTRPIGQRALAVERLAPSGYVRVNGELWKARARGGEVAAGDAVIVRAADGLTLIVEKHRDDRSLQRTGAEAPG